MKKRLLFGLLIIFSLTMTPALANKAAVSIKAPASVKAGEEVTIIINVTHRGNSSLHHTNRLVVMANKKEVGRWNFSSSSRPEAEDFSREVKLNIEGETEIEAEANCNLHGSAGPARVTIKIEEEIH